jgi:hypothetical protein
MNRKEIKKWAEMVLSVFKGAWTGSIAGMVALWLFASCGGGSSSEEVIDLIPIFNGKNYVYINSQGKVAIEPDAKIIESSLFHGNYALAGVEVKVKGTNGTRNETRYGFIDRTGKWAIPPEYVKATIFSEGLAWVMPDNDTFIAIDETGKEVLRLTDASSVRCFREGFASFKSDNGKWGYIDETGKVVIEPVYHGAADFSNGLAAIIDGNARFKQDGKCGYINRKGEMVIPAQFDDAGDFTPKGYAVVGFGSSKDIFFGGGKYGVIDRDGKYVIEPSYNSMHADGDGDIFMVGKWIAERGYVLGYIDIHGKELVPMEFSALRFFKGNDYAGAQRSGEDHYCFIDRNGKTVTELPPPGEVWHSFSDGVTLVQSSAQPHKGKYLTNIKGDTLILMDYMIISPDYDEAYYSYTASVKGNATSLSGLHREIK